MRSGAAAAVVLVAVLSTALAQGARADGDDSPRSAGFVRAHWDYPQRASVGFGVIATPGSASGECSSACLYQGMTFQGSGGIDGGEVAIGYGRLVGELGRNPWMIQRTFVGYGVRAAAIRTWGTSSAVPIGTYVGVEGAMTVAQFGLRLGVYRGAESDSPSGWRIFGGAGWGF
jgi:hypothetical protein